ncbi:MAG: hypothetical protein Q9187_002475 [Circinaria calcarea]
MATAGFQYYCSCSRGTPAERAAAASKQKFYVGMTEICFIHDVIWFRHTSGDIAEGNVPEDKATLRAMVKPEKLEEAITRGAPVATIPSRQLHAL